MEKVCDGLTDSHIHRIYENGKWRGSGKPRKTTGTYLFR